MSRIAIALVAIAPFIALSLSGCSSSDSSSGTSGTSGTSGSSGTCPDDLPAACPAAQPSFAKDISPIFSSVCATCHTITGRAPTRLMTDYAHIKPQVGAVLTQVHSCKMPLPDGPQLTTEQRTLLQTWLICGSPDN